MRRLRDFAIDESQTIKAAISLIQKNETRCVIVVTGEDKVIGTFSEGDVLRAILSGIDIHTPLKKVVRPTFIYLREQNLTKARKYFLQGLTLVPVVDEDFVLKGVVTVFDYFTELEKVSPAV